MADERSNTSKRMREHQDSTTLASSFDQYRDQLQRLVAFHMDRRLTRRVDASDVVQQSFIEARSRLPHFLEQSSMPFSLWIRQITMQTLIDIHRRHFGVQKRDIRQEVSLQQADSSYAILADKLVSNMASPSSMADRREKLARVRDAIDGMDEIDREILVLRHFEEMSNKDIADLLGIGQPAASNRYLRALNRLRTILIDESGAI
jgi:RNA polymerase sigma-70 factor (ECF subfamily)